eukprot:6745606-Alexandrium_andersonii.AAC.1
MRPESPGRAHAVTEPLARRCGALVMFALERRSKAESALWAITSAGRCAMPRAFAVSPWALSPTWPRKQARSPWTSPGA